MTTGSPHPAGAVLPSRRGPYRRKGQRAQVALAFNNEVSPRLGFDRGEFQGEVEPPELRFHTRDILLQQRGEIGQLSLQAMT